MQLIIYSVLDVSRLRALQLSPGQRYIARNGLFYVEFWRFTTQPIKLQCLVKMCYVLIAHIAFHAYLTTYFSSSLQTYKDLYLTDGTLNRNE